MEILENFLNSGFILWAWACFIDFSGKKHQVSLNESQKIHENWPKIEKFSKYWWLKLQPQISKNWKFWNMLKIGHKWLLMVHCMLTKWFLTIWHPFLAKKLKKLKILIFALKHRFWNCVFARSLVTRNWAHLVLNTSKVNC